MSRESILPSPLLMNKLLSRFNPNDVNFRDDFRGKKRLVKVLF